MKKHEEETDDVYLLRCLPKKTIGLDIFKLIGNVRFSLKLNMKEEENQKDQMYKRLRMLDQ